MSIKYAQNKKKQQQNIKKNKGNTIRLSFVIFALTLFIQVMQIALYIYAFHFNDYLLN